MLMSGAVTCLRVSGHSISRYFETCRFRDWKLKLQENAAPGGAGQGGGRGEAEGSLADAGTYAQF